MKIIFLGEGIIAVNSLQSLIDDFEVIQVCTTENPEQDKSKKPVISLSEQNQIPIIHSIKKIDQSLINTIESLNPDMIVVVSFGLFIPSKITTIPRLRTINLHPSSLPKFRGAAPIIRAIENGAEKIGICVIEVISKMDAGDIFAEQTIDIQKNQYASDLYPMIGKIGGNLLVEVINKLHNKTAIRKKQNEQEVTFAKKIQKKELLLNFDRDAKLVLDQIRAFDLSGGCFFVKKGKRIKIWKAEVCNIKHNYASGTMDNDLQIIYCKTNALKPLSLQREGKKITKASDFWNGYRGN